MEESPLAGTLDPVADVDPAAIEQTSSEYLGRWNRLVSTTNWEKGRIICQWRMALMAAGASAHVYSDEAWSRRVGNVSPQHVGRLRRVFEQFGEVYPHYPGLYWSHFLAALDWPDAEMWLEGAAQNGWSVAQMRTTRWQTLDALPEQGPSEAELIIAEPDEDAEPVEVTALPTIAGSIGIVAEPTGDGGEESGSGGGARAESDSCDASARLRLPPEEDARPTVETPRPFEHLPPLPDDLQEAFELFKLAILRHKLAGWREVSCETVLASLEALGQLARVPRDASWTG